MGRARFMTRAGCSPTTRAVLRWCLGMMNRNVIRRWKILLKLIGWVPFLGCAAAVAVGLASAVMAREGEGTPPAYGRTVAVIVSLAVGLQSAFVLSPGDEPALEILLTSPTPLSRIVLERLSLAAALHGSVALAGNLISLALPGGEDVTLAAAAWLAPSICLSGVALAATQLTRQGAFGALMVMMLWGGMAVGGDAMLARWPDLWPLHLFLRPDRVSPSMYAYNRAILILIGLGVMAAAIWLVRNEERMLGIRSAPLLRRR